MSLGHEAEPGGKTGPSSEEGPAVCGHTAVFLVDLKPLLLRL